MIVNLPVEFEFIVLQRDGCEQLIFLEHEIRKHRLAKKIRLRQITHLIGALKQKKQLRRQRMPLLIAVKLREKRIGARVFQQRGSTASIGQQARQAGLARADGAFHHHIAQFVGELNDTHAACSASTRTLARSTPASSSRTGPAPGTSASGAISASGASTKAR